MTRKAYVLAAVLALFLGRSVRAGEPSAKEILKRAQHVMEKTETLSFDATFLGDGALVKTLPVMDGTVLIAKGKSAAGTRIRIDGSKTLPRGASAMPFRFVTDGVTAAYADDVRRIYLSGKDSIANPQERIRLVPSYYVSPKAYEMAMNAASLELGKPRDAGGVPCYVIDVSYDAGGVRRETLCIGKKDMILRSVVTPRSTVRGRRVKLAADSAEIFLARNLSLKPEVNPKMFTLRQPAGYRHQPFVNQSRRTPNGLLKTGTTAPDWTLPDADGKKVSLKSLRGQVVVVDFWASWCGPCKMAMPFLQKLSDKYEGKPVKVFSINCRERRGNAAAKQFLKAKQLTYPQLFEGDTAANAYGVRGIPTMYVIGTDGKILHAERGFRSNLVAIMSQVIDKHLKEAATAKGEKAAKSEKTVKAG